MDQAPEIDHSSNAACAFVGVRVPAQVYIAFVASFLLTGVCVWRERERERECVCVCADVYLYLFVCLAFLASFV